MTAEAKPVTKAFVLLGLTNSVFHLSVLCSAFCPGLTITIEQQNKFSIVMLRVSRNRRVIVIREDTHHGMKTLLVH